MKFLKEVTFDEVQACYRQENSGSEGNRRSESFDWGNGELAKLKNAKWSYVLLSKADILAIVNPLHRHGWESEAGATILTAAKNLLREGACWDNVASNRDLDFSSTHVFLERNGILLKHIDGFHRLLAWVIFDKKQDVPAYVAGDLNALDYDVE